MALFSEQYIDDYRIRRATLDDIAIVMATFHADDGMHIGFQVATEALFREHASHDKGTLTLDAWVAETYDGQIIATADVSGGRGDECLNSSVAIDPAHSGRGLEDALVSLVEARARQIVEWACADECACPEQRQTAEDAATPTARATCGEQGAPIRWEVCPDRAPVHAAGDTAESSAPRSPRGVVVVPVWAWSCVRTPRSVSRRVRVRVRVRGQWRGRGQFTRTCAPTSRGGRPVVDHTTALTHDETWHRPGSPLLPRGRGAGDGAALLVFPASSPAQVADPRLRPLALCA